MILVFTLSMPGCGSWNGQWGGTGRAYTTNRIFRGKAGIAKAKAIQDVGYYRYGFGDGWAAGISVREVTSTEAACLRRKSDGFCGYGWMVDSILRTGKIAPNAERQQT